MDRLQAAARTRKLSEDSQSVISDFLESFLKQRKRTKVKGGMDVYLSTLRKEMAELVVQNIQLMDKLLEVNSTIEYLKARRNNIRNFALCYTDAATSVSSPRLSPASSPRLSPASSEILNEGDDGIKDSTSEILISGDEGFFKTDSNENMISIEYELCEFLKEFDIDGESGNWKNTTMLLAADRDLEDSGVDTASNDGLENSKWADGIANAKTSTL